MRHVDGEGVGVGWREVVELIQVEPVEPVQWPCSSSMWVVVVTVVEVAVLRNKSCVERGHNGTRKGRNTRND